MVLAPHPPRKPHRHANFPPYIRPTRNGRYQARPYCEVDRRRYNLGCYDSVWEAQKAIDEFWAGKRKARAKYVRAIERPDGTTEYFAVVPVNLGGFRSEQAAVNKVEELLRHLGGPLFWASDLHEHGKHDAGRPLE